MFSAQSCYVIQLVAGYDVWASEKCFDVVTCFDTMPYLQSAFHYKKSVLAPGTRFFPKREKHLDLRILSRSDSLSPHPDYALFSSESFSSACFDGIFSGRICGQKSTSWMVVLPVMSIVRRSIPIPRPEVGGMPYSRALTKS